MRQESDRLDTKPRPYRVGDRADVRRVRRDDRVPTTNRAFDNSNVDDVVVTALADEHPDVARLPSGQVFDVTQCEKPSQYGLPAPTSPRFGQNRRGDGRDNFLGKESGMQCPHRTVVALGGNERPGVVGDTCTQEARRFAARPRPSNARARANPSASSSDVSAP